MVHETRQQGSCERIQSPRIEKSADKERDKTKGARERERERGGYFSLESGYTIKSYKSQVVLCRDGDKSVVFWAVSAGSIIPSAFSLSTVFSPFCFLKGKIIIQLLLLSTLLTMSFLSKILCLAIVESSLFVTCDCLLVLVYDESWKIF